jgi:hypothetical protein
MQQIGSAIKEIFLVYCTEGQSGESSLDAIIN